ncbi:MAG: transposase [Planctomycetes bacterium]|nr:transposase [Planctomycetota bacterium]MBI3832946.1 transposase [Planctomycetota bacterium]
MPSRLRRYDHSGHAHFLTISCFRRLQFFRNDSVKRAFLEAMNHVLKKRGIRWLGYVIMPEHVHLLCWPHAQDGSEPVPISTVLHELKQDSGREGKAALRTVWSQQRTLGSRPLDAWATGADPKPFWKPRAYDFNVTSERVHPQMIDYMHKNPVKRGLVDCAEQWAWSSYRFYEFRDASVMAMDWDGGWPIGAQSN